MSALKEYLLDVQFEIRDGGERRVVNGWELAEVNFEDVALMEFLTTAPKGATFGGYNSLYVRRVR